MKIESMRARRDDIHKILRTEEEALNKRLTMALTRLKDQRPELFNISPQEQIGKQVGTLTAAFLEWLVS